MKKLTALLLAAMLVFGLAACAGSPAEPNAKPGDTMTLQDILTSITKDVADLPDTETTALTKDNFEYFAFTAMPVGVEAEKTAVLVHNCTVLLVMSWSNVTDALTANFNALWS